MKRLSRIKYRDFKKRFRTTNDQADTQSFTTESCDHKEGRATRATKASTIEFYVGWVA
jgi:hypothetical protein